MKKMIAPFIIIGILSACALIYGFGIMASLIAIPVPFRVGGIVIVGLLVLAAMGAFVFTLYKRIQEIQKEDDDDLSKY